MSSGQLWIHFDLFFFIIIFGAELKASDMSGCPIKGQGIDAHVAVHVFYFTYFNIFNVNLTYLSAKQRNNRISYRCRRGLVGFDHKVRNFADTVSETLRYKQNSIPQKVKRKRYTKKA